MVTKRALTRCIWEQAVAFHSDPDRLGRIDGLPEMIPAGDGKSIILPPQAGFDIHAFAQLVHAGPPDLRRTFAGRDVEAVVRRAFGSALAGLDTETPVDEAAERLLEAVEARLQTELALPASPSVFAFGGWLIRDQPQLDIAFGPVRFEGRELWLDRMAAEDHITGAMQRRVQHRWLGGTPRPLKDPGRRWREEAVLNAIGDCPTVCTVVTRGLAAGAARDKAMLAARLSLTAFALLWERPARALDGMGLLVDGDARHRRHLVFGERGAMVAANDIARHVGTTWVPPDRWPALWEESGWLIAPIAEALTALVDAEHHPGRPDVVRSLFHALIWLQEASRAEVPLVAAAKFGACLDVLAGGRSEGAILRLVRARLGACPDDTVTRDGRSVRQVVKAIYGAARSQTLHGSNDRYDEDWTVLRELAEHLTRRCFVEVLAWLSDQPGASDLSGALVADASG